MLLLHAYRIFIISTFLFYCPISARTSETFFKKFPKNTFEQVLIQIKMGSYDSVLFVCLFKLWLKMLPKHTTSNQTDSLLHKSAGAFQPTFIWDFLSN